MYLRISKKKLISFTIYYLLIVDFLISVLHFPSEIRYLVDAVFIILALMSLSKPVKISTKTGKSRVYAYIVLYMVGLSLISFIRMVPIGQILWAIRNNFFPIIFFLICCSSLEWEDADRIMQNIVKLQMLNVVCVVYEYFALGKYGDYVGGLFGIEQGCNGSLNVYLVIVCTYVFCGYLYKKVSVWQVTWIIISSLFVALLSELKVFYVELIAIAVAAVFIERRWRGIMLLTVGVIGIILGMVILSFVDPKAANIFSSLASIIKYNSTTIYSDIDIRISRLTAFSQINDSFFGDSGFLRLFGFGLGACEDSASIPICHSEFATKYGYMGYRNLTTAMNYLETGFVGLLAFLVFFVLLIIFAQKVKKSMPRSIEIALFTQVLCVLIIMNCWYNSAIRRPVAYITFFTLSILFVLLRETHNREATLADILS